MARRYVVVYRTGGTVNACWHRALVEHDTKEAAQQFAAEIERGGRRALVFTVAALDAVGLPEGYDGTRSVCCDDRAECTNA